MAEMADSAHRIHLNGLQVIRGIAALAVVLYHEQGFLHGAVPASPTWWFTALFRWGYAGVDVFFVLSGFLIVYVTTMISAWRPALPTTSGAVHPGYIYSIGFFASSSFLPSLSLQPCLPTAGSRGFCV